MAPAQIPVFYPRNLVLRMAYFVVLKYPGGLTTLNLVNQIPCLGASLFEDIVHKLGLHLCKLSFVIEEKSARLPLRTGIQGGVINAPFLYYE